MCLTHYCDAPGVELVSEGGSYYLLCTRWIARVKCIVPSPGHGDCGRYKVIYTEYEQCCITVSNRKFPGRHQYDVVITYRKKESREAHSQSACIKLSINFMNLRDQLLRY